MTLAYVGSNYTRHPDGLDAAFEAVAALTARLVACGVHAFSPIVHGHALARHGGLDPLDLSIWYPFNTEIMKRCDVLIIAHLPGWEASDGIKYEVEFFEKAGKPIYDLEPSSMRMVRRRLEWGGEFVFGRDPPSAPRENP